MIFLLLQICLAIDGKSTESVENSHSAQLRRTKISEQICESGCLICDSDHDHQCRACENQKVLINPKMPCQCVNAYLQDCLTYQQAFLQGNLIYLESNNEFFVSQTFQVLDKIIKISIQGNTFIYQGFDFTECEQLLTQKVIDLLLNSEIYKVIIIITFDSQILSLKCSNVGIMVTIIIVQQKTQKQEQCDDNIVKLQAHKVSIDFNNIPPPNQTLEIQAYKIMLQNIIITAHTQEFQLRLDGITDDIVLNIQNIIFDKVNYTTFQFITFLKDISTQSSIRNINILESEFHYFNLIGGSNVLSHEIQISNLKINLSQITQLNLFLFEAQTFIIDNLQIINTMITNSLILNNFINLKASNISTLNSSLINLVFIQGQPMSKTIIINNFVMLNSILSNSQIVRIYNQEISGEFILESLAMLNVLIEDILFETFVGVNISKVYFTDVQISNVTTSITMICFDSISSLNIINSSINDIIFTSSNQVSVFNLGRFSVLKFSDIDIQSIQSHGIIIKIQCQETISFHISNLYMNDIQAKQFINIDNYPSFIELDNLDLQIKYPQILNYDKIEIPNFIVMIGYHIQITNSTFVFKENAIWIGSVYTTIRQSEFRSNLQLQQLVIYSYYITLVDNHLYETSIYVSPQDEQNQQNVQFNFLNNQITTLSGNSLDLAIIFINDFNVLISNNNFKIKNFGYILLIIANNHEIMLLNNSFTNKSNYFILKTRFTNDTSLLINKTLIYNSQIDQPENQTTHCYPFNFDIDNAKLVLIQDLLIVNQSHSALLIVEVSVIRLINIQVQNTQVQNQLVTLLYFDTLSINTLIVRNIILHNIAHQQYQSLIIFESKSYQSDIIISNLLIHEVEFDYLLYSSLQSSTTNIALTNVHLNKNKCRIACLVITSPSKGFFKLTDLTSKNSLAPCIISFSLPTSFRVFVTNILMDDNNGVVSIVTYKDFPMTDFQIYQKVMIKTQWTFFNLRFKIMNFTPRIMVSFNNGYTIQQIIIEENTGRCLVQLNKGNKYLYIPPFGYSFNNYTRLNQSLLIYQEYKLQLMFFINYESNYQANSTKCSLQSNGTNSSTIFQFLYQDFTYYRVNHYEEYLIEFNITCYLETPLSSIFYAKQLKCQIGEIHLDQCMPCLKYLDQYSISKNDQICRNRNPLTMVSTEMGLIELRKGFWRSEFYTDHIEPCLIWLKSCEGGLKFGDYSCNAGYIGSTCFECDTERQVFRQIDGTCASRQNLIWIFFLIWISISLYLLNMNVQIQIHHLQKRKALVILYNKLSQICKKEPIIMNQALILILQQYQQLSGLYFDRYTNLQNSLITYLVLLSHTDQTPFLLIDQLFSSFYQMNSWIYYRQLFYIILCCLILSIYFLYLLIQWKLKIRQYQFPLILLGCYYLFDLNILIYLKQLVELITPISSSNKYFIYHQMSIEMKSQFYLILIFVFLNLIVLLTVTLLMKRLLKRKSSQSFSNVQSMSKINILTLIIVTSLRQNYMYRLYMSVVSVELLIHFALKSVFSNKFQQATLNNILRALTFQIMLNSFIHMITDTLQITILSHSHSMIWIIINAYFLIKIIPSHLVSKRKTMSKERQGQLVRKFKSVNKSMKSVGTQTWFR